MASPLRPLVALLVLALAACGDGDSETGSTTSSAENSQAKDEPGLNIEGVGDGAAASGADSMQSSQRVEVQAARDTDDAVIRVQLTLDEHWHVNANPASLDFLIPTEVSARTNGTPVPAEADYPDPIQLEVPLGDGAIAVYKGTVTIPLRIQADAAAWREQPVDLRIRLQACNDEGRCLAPSTIQRTLPAPDA